MQDLQEEMKRLRQELNLAITVLKDRGREKAVAEKEYRIALAKEILNLRAMEGKEKIPSSVLNDVARGKDEIAYLKLKRDIAESLYNTVQERIMATKLEIKIVENEMEAIRNCK